MIKKLYLVVASFFVCIYVARANIGVPSIEEHISRSRDIVMGSFEVDHHDNIYFLVERSFKGNVVILSKMLINSDSKLAWRFLPGGRIVSPQEHEFKAMIQNKKWFSSPVIMLGEFENGLWKSSYYDWSIWPHGEIEFKNRSINDVVNIVSEQLDQINAKTKKQ